MHRRTIEPQEWDWAREFELDSLPAETRFPQQGDCYEALEDVTVGFTTAWHAPCSDGGEGLLLRGERVIIEFASDPRPLGVIARGVDHETLEIRMVPAKDRRHKLYGGFALSLHTRDLNSHFRLVAPQEGPPPG